MHLKGFSTFHDCLSFIQSLTLWFLHVRSLTSHSHSFVHVLKDVKFESENREYSANTQNSKQLLALAIFHSDVGIIVLLLYSVLLLLQFLTQH